jgi:hypothetical protein
MCRTALSEIDDVKFKFIKKYEEKHCCTTVPRHTILTATSSFQALLQYDGLYCNTNSYFLEIKLFCTIP